MTLRSRYFLAAAAGLWMALPLPGQEPARLPMLPAAGASINQQLADQIAEHVRQSGQLRHYQVGIAFQNGTAELTGTVANQGQREEVLRIVQGVPGVERVINRVNLAGSIAQVQGTATAQDVAPMPHMIPPAGAGAVMAEPMPIAQGPVGGPSDLNPPTMPPYAWPTYAPYNNYSRVAYPTAYPYQAWPFIGPVYPFPKVPLGWRSVKLEWQDGHWWLGKTATHHDWWRVRYW